MKKFLSNREILIKNNHPIDLEISIGEGSILTFENSDIAFHADYIIKSLNKDSFKYYHKSPYDKEGKWRPKEVKMMYLLTKSINSQVIKLLQLDIPRFLAVSITGMGGTEIEPNVKNHEKVFKDLKELIDNGFDPNDIVIRIDPIYPGLNTPDVNSDLIADIVKNISELKIKQIYTSVLIFMVAHLKRF
jgi:DNA repair photolyase